MPRYNNMVNEIYIESRGAISIMVVGKSEWAKVKDSGSSVPKRIYIQDT